MDNSENVGERRRIGIQQRAWPIAGERLPQVGSKFHAAQDRASGIWPAFKSITFKVSTWESSTTLRLICLLTVLTIVAAFPLYVMGYAPFLWDGTVPDRPIFKAKLAVGSWGIVVLGIISGRAAWGLKADPLRPEWPVEVLIATDGSSAVIPSLSAHPDDLPEIRDILEKTLGETVAVEGVDESRCEQMDLTRERLQECRIVCSELRMKPTKPGDGLLKGKPAAAYAGEDEGRTWPMDSATQTQSNSPYHGFVQVLISPRKDPVSRVDIWRDRIRDGRATNWLLRRLRYLMSSSGNEEPPKDDTGEHTPNTVDLDSAAAERSQSLNAKHSGTIFDVNVRGLVAVPPSEDDHQATQIAKRIVKPFADGTHETVGHTVAIASAPPGATQTRADRVKAVLPGVGGHGIVEATKSAEFRYTRRWRWLGLSKTPSRANFIVDHEELPRYLPIGDGLSPKARAALDVIPKDSTPPGNTATEHQQTFTTGEDALDPQNPR